MDIKSQLQAELISAMKSGDTITRDTLRMIVSALKNDEISRGAMLTDEQTIEVIAREAKRLKEAMAEFQTAGRNDLVEQYVQNVNVITKYLPVQASDEEIEAVVAPLIASSGVTGSAALGKVMGTAMQELKGKAEGTRVRAIAEKILAG